MLKNIFFLFYFIILSATSGWAKYTHEAYYVYGQDNIKLFASYKELSIDHVSPYGFELYGPVGLGNYLQRTGVKFVKLVLPVSNLRSAYQSPEDIANRLKQAASSNPAIAQMFSIGKSVQGRDLWVIKISKNVQVNDQRPEFKYIANMHGDEIVGRELMVLLIEDLISNYGRDEFITKLVDSTQIYILPSMNPDGAQLVRRGNANWVDLNRDFPDFSESDNQNTPDGRAPETQAIMKWQATRKFVMSANFHGGAEVVNYPWDTVPDKFPLYDLVRGISIEYASNAPYIGASKVFKNGITNGYEWYEVNGGMQDWTYYWYRDLQFTIELSDLKYPDPSTIQYYYEQNRKALLVFMTRVHTINQSRMLYRR